MTDDDKNAMQAAWDTWHTEVSRGIRTRANAPFERGFKAGMTHARAASDAVIAGLRGENAVLADILRDADKVIAAIESGDVTTYSLHDLGMAISHALEPYKANGDLLI
jgi:hypothetical protein